MSVLQSKISQGYLLPYTKMTGLMNLSNLHSAGFPCADVQMLLQVEDLPTDRLFTVRTAVASGNDFYLPSIWGATAEEIFRWWQRPIDLKPFSTEVKGVMYSFGLHRYPTFEEREANRYKPLKDIKGLQLFYYPYFVDAPPHGVRGRVALYPPEDKFPEAVIEVAKPHLITDRNRELKAMQHIVETIIISGPSIRKYRVSGFEALAEERIDELVITATEIQKYLIQKLKMDSSKISLEWSYCTDFPNSGMERKEDFKLRYWGLRSS